MRSQVLMEERTRLIDRFTSISCRSKREKKGIERAFGTLVASTLVAVAKLAGEVDRGHQVYIPDGENLTRNDTADRGFTKNSGRAVPSKVWCSLSRIEMPTCKSAFQGRSRHKTTMTNYQSDVSSV